MKFLLVFLAHFLIIKMHPRHILVLNFYSFCCHFIVAKDSSLLVYVLFAKVGLYVLIFNFWIDKFVNVQLNLLNWSEGLRLLMNLVQVVGWVVGDRQG